MKARNIIAILLLVLTLGLAVWAYTALPETVTTQVSLSGGSATTMPKLLALLIPVALSAGGAAACLLNKTDAKAKTKGVIVSGVGAAVIILTLIVNL